eukprot:SM000444S16339  [mRNA]  locus=s444:107:1827:+ [translate_table: standard]
MEVRARFPVAPFAAALVDAVLPATGLRSLTPSACSGTRVQYSAVTGRVYSSTLDALRSIARTEGLHGLFRGLGVTIARDAPYSGLYLLMYDNLRCFLRNELKQNTPQTTINFVAGAVAGGSATLLTHPPDVVTTKHQLHLPRCHVELAFLYLINNLTPLKALQEHGVRGFFKGVTPRVAKRALQQALSWTLFEEITRRVSGRNIWGLQK